MSRKVTLAVSSLNQWAMDFKGNYFRILESIIFAKEKGAQFRSGPELEITGYGCADHFHESDTFMHSWEVLAELMKHPECQDIIIDVGMPVLHKNDAYNCRVTFFNRELLLIRPKMLLCDFGNYRESRWFSAWKKPRVLEAHILPQIIKEITGQNSVPMGDGVLSFLDTCIGYGMGGELWDPNGSHVAMGLDGVEIFVNGSGRHHELGKAYEPFDLVESASAKIGGVYMYSNLRGCDGERVYYTGGSTIAVNGSIVAHCAQFSLQEVEVATATVDLEDIQTYRNLMRSRNLLGSCTESFPRVEVNCALSVDDGRSIPTQQPTEVTYHTLEEEISLGPACWLWDYLRRSGQGGFFLPLSGGVNSASTACIVYAMCCHVVAEVQSGDVKVLEDLQRIIGDVSYRPSDPKELCSRILVTCFMGTQTSSKGSKERAKQLGSRLGSYHLAITIDAVVAAMLGIFTALTGMGPKFKARGGSDRENRALLHLQARLRMVVAYLIAQLIPWVQGRPRGLLVLGASNADDALRGFKTKYDYSYADINPIGGISRGNLKRFLKYACDKLGLSMLESVLSAPPSSEWQTLADKNHGQVNDNTKLNSEELSICARLRKQNCCGPVSMFRKLVLLWTGKFTATEVAHKVKYFFLSYALSRHKLTVMTPAYHAEMYSADDNRFDHRPFLYNIHWRWQFLAIDSLLRQMTAEPQISARFKGLTLQPLKMPSRPIQPLRRSERYSSDGELSQSSVDDSMLQLRSVGQDSLNDESWSEGWSPVSSPGTVHAGRRIGFVPMRSRLRGNKR